MIVTATGTVAVIGIKCGALLEITYNADRKQKFHA